MTNDGARTGNDADRPAPFGEAAHGQPAHGQPAQGLIRREAPGAGLVLAIVGLTLLLLGFFALDWAPHTSFLDIWHKLDGQERDANGVNDLTLFYVVVASFVLMAISTLLSGLAGIGRAAVRIGAVVIGAIIGVLMIGVVVLIEASGAGNDDTRANYLGLFVAIVILGLLIIALGVGALLEKSGWLARSLALLVAVIAIVMHLASIGDLFGGDSALSIGAWLPAVGFLALAVAPMLPYRRVS